MFAICLANCLVLLIMLHVLLGSGRWSRNVVFLCVCVGAAAVSWSVSASGGKDSGQDGGRVLM